MWLFGTRATTLSLAERLGPRCGPAQLNHRVLGTPLILACLPGCIVTGGEDSFGCNAWGHSVYFGEETSRIVTFRAIEGDIKNAAGRGSGERVQAEAREAEDAGPCTALASRSWYGVTSSTVDGGTRCVEERTYATLLEERDGGCGDDGGRVRKPGRPSSESAHGGFEG